MAEELAKIARGQTVTRVYVGVVTAVTGHTVTVDPGDGQTVTQVPWYGQSPLVADTVVMLLSEGQLLAISAGRPS
jgi:hypothetical protein